MKHEFILIAGALALLVYCQKKKNLNASTAAANAPGAATTYTAQQAPAAAEWWVYAGNWQQ